jgi:hypothetical protein
MCRITNQISIAVGGTADQRTSQHLQSLLQELLLLLLRRRRRLLLLLLLLLTCLHPLHQHTWLLARGRLVIDRHPLPLPLAHTPHPIIG